MTVIPRHAATYTYADLWTALRAARAGDARADLCRALARLAGVRHVLLFSAAHVALYALLRAYNRPGAVLLPAYNGLSVPEAVSFAGYTPAFVDVDCRTLNAGGAALRAAVAPGVTAVLLTHLFGVPAEIDDLAEACRRRDILLIEDAAPALGARLAGRVVGALGDAAIVSFAVAKALFAGGGGALLTDNDDLAARVAAVAAAAPAPRPAPAAFARAFAWKSAVHPVVYPATRLAHRTLRGEAMHERVPPRPGPPPNFVQTCSSFTAALALAQVPRLEANLRRRRRLAAIYAGGLSDCPGLRLPAAPPDSAPAWIQYSLQVDDRGSFYRCMQRQGIDLSWTYRYSCAESYGLEGFSVAGRAARSVVGLPTYPSLSDDQALRVLAAVKAYPGAHGR